MDSQVAEKARMARDAAYLLANTSTVLKNSALENIAGNLVKQEDRIMSANRIDLENLKQKPGYTSAFYDRLLLDSARIKGMAGGLQDIMALPDPVGEIESMWKRPNGLQVGRVRVPMGVVGIIYEARPNVTVDAAALALKSGNAVVLRGSSEALNSNKALVDVIRESLVAVGIPPECVVLIEDTGRAAVQEMMRLNEYLDVLIPRGGPALIKNVIENSTVPVIQTGAGNCHTYVDEGADTDMAVAVAVNAKVHRPGVCNAMETLLVHSSAAESFLPPALDALFDRNVEVRGCSQTQKFNPGVKPAGEEDWKTEYLDLILAVRVVDSIDEAIGHINRYGTGHSECIVTSDYRRSQQFLNRVDAAAVYVNASTRFTDGYEFGLGAEMGISTQKLHARGPMGLQALTSLKYIIYGDGQVRG